MKLWIQEPLISAIEKKGALSREEICSMIGQMVEGCREKKIKKGKDPDHCNTARKFPETDIELSIRSVTDGYEVRQLAIKYEVFEHWQDAKNDFLTKVVEETVLGSAIDQTDSGQ